MSCAYSAKSRKNCRPKLRLAAGTAAMCLFVLGVVASIASPALAGYAEGLTALNAKDYELAYMEFRKVAEQGHAAAQNELGVLYATGRGVERDYAEAVRWYREAAEQGLAWAHYNLGVMYAEGRGVPQDWIKAYKWISLSVAKRPDDGRVRYLGEIKEKLTSVQVAEANEWVRNWRPRRPK